MSRSVDLFIDARMDLADLAAHIREITGLAFVAGEAAGRWVTSDDGFEATLGVHPYVDDGHLLFSTYRYALSSRVANSVRPQEAPETLMLRMVAEQLQRKAGMSVLLVIDLQYRDGGHGGRGSGPASAWASSLDSG